MNIVDAATRESVRAGRGLYRPMPNRLLAIVLAALTAVVLLVLGLVLRGHPFDLRIVVALNHLHTGMWAVVSDAIYVMIGPIAAVVLTIAIAGLVGLISRSLTTALSFGAVVALTWLPVAVLKVIVDRPRPESSALSHVYVPAQVDGSYPSGHTAFVVALTFAIWFLLRDTRWGWLAVVLGAAATALVGVAVVSDGLHYPTDVLASIVWVVAMAPVARLIVVDVVVGFLRKRYGRRSTSAAD